MFYKKNFSMSLQGSRHSSVLHNKGKSCSDFKDFRQGSKFHFKDCWSNRVCPRDRSFQLRATVGENGGQQPEDENPNNRVTVEASRAPTLVLEHFLPQKILHKGHLCPVCIAESLKVS